MDMKYKRKFKKLLVSFLVISFIVQHAIPALAYNPVVGSVNLRSNQVGTIDCTTGGAMQLLQSNGDRWNTIEREKIPGTTTLVGASNPTIRVEQAGGISQDQFELNTVELDGDLHALKSYFSFGDEILCMGSGIENKSGEVGSKVITTVDNIPMIISNGMQNYLALTKPQATHKKVTDTTFNPIINQETAASHTRNWLYVSELANSGTNKGYGYYFPNNLKVSNVYFQLIKGETATNPEYFELWIEHNNNTSYEYFILPEKTATILNDTAYSPKITKLLNTEKAHAVLHQESNTIGANIWVDSLEGVSIPNSIATFQSKQKASILLKKDVENNQIEIVVSDTTKLNTGTIELEVQVKGNIHSTSHSDRVSAVSTENTTQISINVAGLNGAPVTVVIDMNVGNDSEEVEAVIEYHENENYKFGVDTNATGNIGMTYIKNPVESDDIGVDFWNIINRNRLPGMVLANSTEKSIKGSQTEPNTNQTTSSWIGGATKLDGYGVKGVELTGGKINGVQSYFMFDNQIVCLGAGLNATSDQANTELIAVLENYKLRDDLKNIINMDYANKTALAWHGLEGKGKKDVIYNQANKGLTTKNSWMYISRTDTQANGVGYYFPTSRMDQIEYRFAENTNGSTTKNFYELWLNLGNKQDADYEYVLFPKAANPTEIKNYLTKQDHSVLVNTKQMQAVYNEKLQIVGVNIWNELGGVLESDKISNLKVDKKASLLVKEKEGELAIAISDPSKTNTGMIRLEIAKQGYGIIQKDDNITVDITQKDKVIITVDVSEQTGESYSVSIDTIPEIISPDIKEVTIVRGESITLPCPQNFTGDITWRTVFLKKDGTTINNAGYNKYKRELKEGETEGVRKAGSTDAKHIATVEALSDNNGLVTGKQKGTVSVIATDATGLEEIWTVEILYTNPDNLPVATKEDYKRIRQAWKESVIGTKLQESEMGQDSLASIEEAANKYWNSYAYKGQETCHDIPWPLEVDPVPDADGNYNKEDLIGAIDTPYRDDAAEFRPAIQHVYSMAKAYAAEGSSLYKNPQLLKDMINILDWITTDCYTKKTQTNNWWTWEIGIPKDFIPLLILLHDDLTKEQIEQYCEPMVFFQPDPFYEGHIDTASTHALGYRDNKGANLLDCSVTALGLGAILEDNEQVYLGQLASATELIIYEVEDSTTLSKTGYASGFYKDGSYLDHSFVPYTGSYGIEYFKGGVRIAALLNDTPWQYPEEIITTLEKFVLDGFTTSMYNGLMLDMLKGRSVSRKAGSDREAGREVLSLMLQLTDAVSEEAQATFKTYMKNWMKIDEAYISSLKGAENITVRNKAIEVLEDSSVSTGIPILHKNMTYMDRAIHRAENYLFGLSMYSSRIQNCEVINGENLYGWHQGDGATYLYNGDITHYTNNYWNTVNPFRLAGTTVVPINIGTGIPDSSGYYQEGDYRSYEDWVGGSSIGTNGINGMSLSGENTSEKTDYAPNLRALKSWFMFSDEIVCLGTGIKDADNTLPVETTVENRRLKGDASNQVTVDGIEMDIPIKQNNVKNIVEGTEDTTGITVTTPKWIHLEGNQEGADIGYYFPKSYSNIQIRKTENTGDWSNIGTSSGESVECYLELWFNHGVNPENETYEYVLLPGKTAKEMETYEQKPNISILSNTKEVQAVYEEKDRILGVNFWTDTKQTIKEVTAYQKASVMIQENSANSTITIAVSDPTMKNSNTIELDIEKPLLGVISKDDTVTITEIDSGFHLSVKTKGTNGTSCYAVIKTEVQQNPDKEEPENPDKPDEEEPENPDKPDEEKPENPDKPDEEEPENPDKPDEEKPENPDKPDEEKPENPDKPDEEKPENPGGNTNTGGGSSDDSWMDKKEEKETSIPESEVEIEEGKSSEDKKEESIKQGSSNTVIYEVPVLINKKEEAVVRINSKLTFDLIQKAKEQGSLQDKFVVQLDMPIKEEQNKVSVQISQAALKDLIDAKVKTLNLVGETILYEIPLKTLKKIRKESDGIVTMTANKLDRITLSKKARKIVGNRPIYQLELTYLKTKKDKKVVKQLSLEEIWIGIPYTKKKNEAKNKLYAVSIDKNGIISDVEYSYYNERKKMFFFAKEKSSVYAIAYPTDK